MAAELESEIFGGQQDAFELEVAGMSSDELRQRIRLLDNEIRIMRSDMSRIKHETNTQKEHIKDNKEKN